ncbi:hypothetical protein LINPERPRIM_LOCUS14911 [Linum perenne]
MAPPPISSASTVTEFSVSRLPPPTNKSHTDSVLSRSLLPWPTLPFPSSIIFPPPLLPRRQTLSSISPSKCCPIRNQGANSGPLFYNYLASPIFS